MHDVIDAVPIWFLGGAFVLGSGLLAWLGRHAVHRLFPDLSTGGNNVIAGSLLMILSGLYGMLAAFTIVSLYADFRDAQEDIHQEASHLAQLYRSAGAFDPETRDAVRGSIEGYVDIVVEDEWDEMAKGRMDDRAWAAVDDLYAELQAFEPDTPTESAFYSAAVTELSDMVAARRARATHVVETLPGPILVLIFCGALLLVGFTFFFGSDRVVGQSLMFAFVGAFVGFTLFVIVSLDYPFVGDIAVTPEAFEQGALAQLP